MRASALVSKVSNQTYWEWVREFPKDLYWGHYYVLYIYIYIYI